MSDDTNQNAGYVGGFTFGGVQQGGFQQQPVVQQPQIQPQAPVQPAASFPQQPEPVQPQPQVPQNQAPMAGFGDDDFGGAAEPQGDPNYKFGSAMGAGWTTSIKLPPHSLNFDENKFLNLLAGSISLNKDEKLRIIESVPKLRQEQVDELIRIFEEEREKFLELSVKHSSQLKKLEAEHAADWTDIELHFRSQQTAQHDQNQAEEIRKQLGL